MKQTNQNMDLKYWMYLRIKAGAMQMHNNRIKCTLFLGMCIIVIFLLRFKEYIWGVEELTLLDKVSFYSYFWLINTCIFFALLYSFGQGRLAYKSYRMFQYIGMQNHLGQVPILIYKKRLENNLFCMMFVSRGISIEEWNLRKTEVENILNATISQIEIGKKKNEILIYGMEGNFDLHETYLWDDGYLCEDEPIIYAGRGIRGNVAISLDMYPHILIGGGTGSGKTWLLMNLLHQVMQLQYEVYIADFKGGVNYPLIWKKRCIFIEEKEALIDNLSKIINELNRRKRIFVNKGHSNIDEFNHYEIESINRIVFACDEVAELFDTSGMNKEEKEQKKKIEGMVATIARLGRAFGIHLILATQRPDADILPGQIKNNIPYRICGRADNVLSKIILDNTEASKQLHDDVQGAFINHRCEVFKGFIMSQENRKNKVERTNGNNNLYDG